VALVRTDILEECIASNIEVKKLAIRSSKTLVLKRAIWNHIPEDAILHSHRRENLKPYINEKHFLIPEYVCVTNIQE
jgi:hypothetical protein